MKKLLFASLGLFLATTLVKAQNETPTLELSMRQPQVNKKTGFQYTGTLAQKPECKSILYYTVKNNIYAFPLDNAVVGKKLVGSFTLPDSAQAFALVFKAGDDIDKNNDLGYVYNIYQNSQPVPGTYASEASFFGNMSGLFGIKPDFDKAASLYEKEFALHPEEKTGYEQQYQIAILYGKGNNAAIEKLKTQWQNDIRQKAPEDSLMQLYNLLAGFDRKDAAKYTEDLITVYPAGLLAARTAANKLFSLQDADSIITQYDALKTTYPGLDKAVNQEQFNYIVAQKYLASKNLDKFQEYADKLVNNRMRSSIYNAAAWPIAESGNKDSLAIGVQLAKKSTDAALAMKNDKPSYYTQEDWDKICQSNYGQVADTYAYLLFQQGNIKEALALQQEAVPGLDADADLSQRLVQYLVANGDYTQALDKAGAFVKAGKGNAAIKAFAKEAYVKDKGAEDGFDTFYAGLEAIANEKMLAEIKAKMINEPGHEFALKDLEGNEVSLASLKGKVVVVDFWATWCGPCKMSFPGMQLALDKYKNDPDVAFLFIDTWERQPTMAQRTKEVKALMDANKYTFHVLLDSAVTEDKSKYEVVSAYNVTGIPTKFVLGKDGNVRFTAIGFDGNSQKLADELSTMIELAKKG